MEIKVHLNNLRIAPRKTRLSANLIKGKKVAAAQSVLSFTVNRPAKHILKLLNSAVASAKNDFHLDESNLFVSKIFVDEGQKLKRWHAMSRGRGYPILKRTSHITLVLSEANPTVGKTKKEKNKEKKVKKIAKKEIKIKKKVVKNRKK